MAENIYEGMFILDANRYVHDANGAQQTVESFIEKAGGKLLASRMWEERRLAYPINGQRKGVYWLTYFSAEGDTITPLTRTCEINDLILRQLFLKLHPALADAIVAHATGSGQEEVADDATEETVEADSSEGDKAEVATADTPAETA